MNKLIAGIAAGVAILGGVAAFALTQPGPAPTAGGADDAGDAASILAKSAEAYAKAAGLSDLMRLDISLPDGTKEIVEVPYALGAGNDSWVHMPSLRATALGNSLYIVRDEVADKYAELDLQTDMRSSLESLFGGEASLPVAFDMRKRRGLQSYLAGLGLGVLLKPRLAGYEKVANGTPGGEHRLTLAGDNGTGTVRIDAATNLLSSLDVDTHLPDDATSRIKARVTFAPKVHASPEGLVTFAPGNRRRVTSFRELQPTPVAVGDMAPDFTLKTLDGESVTLSDLRGSVVVIDFWATWCRPCIMGLPLLQEFHDWAKESGRPIKVYAIDTFENGPQDRVEKQAASFWQSQRFTMPTLLDPGSAAVARFGIQSIPTTYVIDPEGVIAKVHQGFDPKMAKTLQQEVVAVLDR